MDDYERAVGGMDFDEEKGKVHGLGAALFEGGPDAFLEQLEDMIPESWREQIANYPLTALSVGFGVGFYLGMKRGSEVISAGSAMLSAAATAGLSEIISDFTAE